MGLTMKKHMDMAIMKLTILLQKKQKLRMLKKIMLKQMALKKSRPKQTTSPRAKSIKRATTNFRIANNRQKWGLISSIVTYKRNIMKGTNQMDTTMDTTMDTKLQKSNNLVKVTTTTATSQITTTLMVTNRLKHMRNIMKVMNQSKIVTKLTTTVTSRITTIMMVTNLLKRIRPMKRRLITGTRVTLQSSQARTSTRRHAT
mmetsp:Transcript_37406/g.55736  ORF Transcript_37406/g.55736 Transcript_37406/m.55736 type:complete len:201 (-) Transcript_37406:61-663(-)